MRRRNRNTTQKIITKTHKPFKSHPLFHRVMTVIIVGFTLFCLGWIVYQAPRDVFYGFMCMGLGYVLGMRHKPKMKQIEQEADESHVNEGNKDESGGG